MSGARPGSSQDPRDRPAAVSRGFSGLFRGFSAKIGDSGELRDAHPGSATSAQVFQHMVEEIGESQGEFPAAQVSPVTDEEEDGAQAVARVEHAALYKEIEDHRMIAAAALQRVIDAGKDVNPRLEKHIEDCTISLSMAEAQPDIDFVKTVMWMREFLECTRAHWHNLKSSGWVDHDDEGKMTAYTTRIEPQLQPPASPEQWDPAAMFEDSIGARAVDQCDNHAADEAPLVKPQDNAPRSKPKAKTKAKPQAKGKVQAGKASDKAVVQPKSSATTRPPTKRARRA